MSNFATKTALRAAVGLSLGFAAVRLWGTSDYLNVTAVLTVCTLSSILVSTLLWPTKNSNSTEQVKKPPKEHSFSISKTYRGTAKSDSEIDEFRSSIKVELLDDGNAVLLEDLNYYIGRKKAELNIVVPKEFKTDFASIPSLFQWIVPKFGYYNGAAVLHDWLYQTHKVGFRLANAVMYDAMVEAGVPHLRRTLIYIAIRSPFAARAYWSGPRRLEKNCPHLIDHIVR